MRTCCSIKSYFLKLILRFNLKKYVLGKLLLGNEFDMVDHMHCLTVLDICNPV